MTIKRGNFVVQCDDAKEEVERLVEEEGWTQNFTRGAFIHKCDKCS